MKWWQQLKKRDTDLEKELRSDLELEEEEQRERGLSPNEARYAARRAFGNTTLIREQTHETWGWGPIERLWQDLRYATRQLRRFPGFSTSAILTLALGIGASALVFSVADAVILRPLPYPHPEQLVRVWEQMPNGHRPNVAESNFEDFRTQNGTFASLAAYDYGIASVSGGSEPARVNASAVSRDFFRTLGVQAFRGRLFAEDERPRGAPAIIVSYGFWQRYLGGVADFSKYHLDLEGGSYPVVGVMPPGFDFPAGVAVWIARDLDPPAPSRTGHNWQVVGRVRDGVTIAQARADLHAIARRILQQYGTQVDLNDAAVVPLPDVAAGDVRSALLTLLGAVALLLTVACANVAGLLVARTAARNRELAVRAALGAGRGRLTQQFLVESLALSLSAGALGTLLAVAGVHVLPSILPVDLPRKEGIAINGAVLLFALAVTVTVAAALGIFAAWRAGGTELRTALSAGPSNASGSTPTQRLRSALVVGEIAVALVILVGAGLLGRSLLHLLSTNPGFSSENLVTMEFSPPIPNASAGLDHSEIVQQISLLDDITARLRQVPGVESLGIAGAVPVAAGDNLPEGTFLLLNGHDPPANLGEFGRMAQNRAQTGHALYAVASGGYFRTLGIPLMRGRIFSDQETPTTTNVAVISQALARRQWLNQDPIGQTIEFGNMDGNLKPLTIIGIVGDVRVRGLNSPPDSVIYVDYRQRGMWLNSTPTVLVRSSTSGKNIVSTARDIFRELAPDVPVKFSTFDEQLSAWSANQRFLLTLIGLFALAALLLVAVGLYGVIAFFVTTRTQEIGIRMAIGAQRIDVLWLVLGEGARLACFGIVIGVAGSLATTRLFSSFLFGIRATDPATFIGVALMLGVVALAASYIPARRALRVDPITALRYE
jgi:putative ABC transport system permease protein